MIGVAAFKLFVTLYSDRNMHFIKNGVSHSFWQHYRLITTWSSKKKVGYEAARQAYLTVMRACNISSNKVTHCGRVSGMCEATVEGVNQAAVASMFQKFIQK